MRYTKPHVLKTMNANVTIQSGTDPNAKGNPIVQDSAVPSARSTTAAYEADE